MNSTTKVVVRFNGETPEDENGLFKMILIPTEGSCASDKCVWIPKSSSQHMTEDGWRVAEYKFPLESNKEYNVSVFLELAIFATCPQFRRNFDSFIVDTN